MAKIISKIISNIVNNKFREKKTLKQKKENI